MGVIASTFREISGDSLSIDQQGIATAERRFLCKMDRFDDNPFLILTFPRTPKPFELYPGSTGVYATTPAVSRMEQTATWFRITVPYSSEREIHENPDPTRRPADVEWGAEAYRRVMLRDIFDQPILNTARDYFIPPLEDEDSRWVITVSKHVKRIPRKILTMDGATNDDVVRIDGETFKRHTLRVRGLRLSRVKIENNVRFRTVNFGLHYQEEGWVHRIASRGFRQLVEVPDSEKEQSEKGKKVFRLEEIRVDGERPSDPVFLDKDGKFIDKPTAKTIVIQEFHTVKRRTFKGVLPLK